MEPFATLPDLKARWVDMPQGSDQHALILLQDATDYIMDTCPTAADARATTRRRITCAMVRRVLEAEQLPSGVDSVQETTGPFSTSFKFTDSALFLRKDEKRALGQRPKAYGVQIIGVRRTPVQHAASCSLWYGLDDCDCPAVRNAS